MSNPETLQEFWRRAPIQGFRTIGFKASGPWSFTFRMYSIFRASKSSKGHNPNPSEIIHTP